MHIPENYLSPATCADLTAAMVPVWVHAVWGTLIATVLGPNAACLAVLVALGYILSAIIGIAILIIFFRLISSLKKSQK